MGKHGTALIRGKCATEGCNRLRKSGGKNRWGQQTYKPDCWKCRAARFHMPNIRSRAELRKMILKGGQDAPCVRCGWNEAACDAHRILSGKEGGRYEAGNVVALCPNCHRLVTRGLITFPETINQMRTA